MDQSNNTPWCDVIDIRNPNNIIQSNDLPIFKFEIKTQHIGDCTAVIVKLDNVFRIVDLSGNMFVNGYMNENSFYLIKNGDYIIFAKNPDLDACGRIKSKKSTDIKSYIKNVLSEYDYVVYQFNNYHDVQENDAKKRKISQCQTTAP